MRGDAKTESALEKSRAARVTLDDVAREASVSAATVSRFLNQPDQVKPEKRGRIERAVEALGYVPHGAARALASRRSRTIGAIFPSLDSDLFGGVLETFQKELAKASYTVIAASTGYETDQEAVHVRNLLQSGVDALMLVGGERPKASARLLTRASIPIVQAWVSESENGHACVGFDNRAAAAQATDFLLMLGHQRVAVISGLLDGNDRARARLESARDRLESAGLSLPDRFNVQRPFGVNEGRDAFRLLMSLSAPPTAILCGSELFAYGAILEADAVGVPIPDAVSIIGFDDMWLASQLKPGLTTVRTPRAEMGREAARYLLARLTGEPVHPPRPLEYKLVVRGSTAPAPTT